MPAPPAIRDASTSETIQREMFDAARAFFATMPSNAPDTVQFPFDAEERTFWNFVPITGQRKGMAVKSMSLEQHKATHRLLQSVLFAKGYLKATAIQQLERMLGEIENNPTRRDPGFYYLTIFGEPSMDSPWGWRYEGHHFSLNVTVAGGMITTTPTFMGANPAEVREGAFAGWELLHEESKLGFQLIHSLSPDQRTQAIIADTAPRDIITGNQREAILDTYEGLPFSEMSSSQQDLLILLLGAYVHNLNPILATRELNRIHEAGLNNLYFAWAGSLSPERGHYYRIHGPQTLIEFDNTQNNANHIHTVWRDFSNDFGRDVLRLHYEQSEH